jgi:hypothetical protein
MYINTVQRSSSAPRACRQGQITSPLGLHTSGTSLPPSGAPVHEHFLAFRLGGLHSDPYASSSFLNYGFPSGRELKSEEHMAAAEEG